MRINILEFSRRGVVILPFFYAQNEKKVK